MTRSGWVFMIASWVAILVTLTYCLVRTLRQKDAPDGEA